MVSLAELIEVAGPGAVELDIFGTTDATDIASKLSSLVVAAAAFAGAFDTPGIQIGQVFTIPFAAAQVERYLDAFSFIVVVQHGATILYNLEFYQLGIVAIRNFQYKFPGLETGRFLLCGE